MIDDTEETNITYGYDASGNRITKKYAFGTIFSEHPQYKTYTDFYVRDAQGNVLAVYKKEVQYRENGMELGSTFNWMEQHL